MTKNADLDKYSYSKYDTNLMHSELSRSDGRGFGKNAILFSADMSSLMHIDSKNKDILILGKGSTDGLDDSTLTAEKDYSINFV